MEEALIIVGPVKDLGLQMDGIDLNGPDFM